jgi:hypothetical protein
MEPIAIHTATAITTIVRLRIAISPVRFSVRTQSSRMLLFYAGSPARASSKFGWRKGSAER